MLDCHKTHNGHTNVYCRMGYWHAHQIVVASHYGVPQHRRRLVLIDN